MGGGVELTELAENLIGFEVDAFDRVIVTATLDGGPAHDAGGGGAEWVAHVGLLVNFLGTGTRAAVGDEFFGSEIRVFGAVDDVEEAEFDGVGHGDAEEQVPRRVGPWSDGVMEWWRNG